MNNIKQRLRTKPARLRRANSLIRKRSVRIVNLHRLPTATRGRGIGQQLCMAAFLQTDKPENGFFDRATDGQ